MTMDDKLVQAYENALKVCADDIAKLQIERDQYKAAHGELSALYYGLQKLLDQKNERIAELSQKHE
jgi:hypothetical protein